MCCRHTVSQANRLFGLTLFTVCCDFWLVSFLILSPFSFTHYAVSGARCDPFNCVHSSHLGHNFAVTSWLLYNVSSNWRASKNCSRLQGLSSSFSLFFNLFRRTLIRQQLRLKGKLEWKLSGNSFKFNIFLKCCSPSNMKARNKPMPPFDSPFPV